MKAPIRKGLLVLLAIIILLPVAAYWLADTWLESSGGRKMLEQELTKRVGMGVRLTGEFDLMLLPDIGVSGTGLVIAGAGGDSEFARSREYEISVALQPLLERRVLVEWVRLTGGVVHPDRYSRIDDRNGPDPEASGAASAAKFQLPEIGELTIRDFQIVLAGEDDNPLQLKELTLQDFAENRETPFALEIENLAAVGGRLRWDAAQSLVHFGNLQLDVAGQSVRGRGCLFLHTPPSMHFDMQAGVFDLDAFRENLPITGNGSGEGGDGLPLEIRARFTADELRTNGAIARAVVLSLGDEPACE
jgi:uncharacterized protein involved in outer membrane biogenesis